MKKVARNFIIALVSTLMLVGTSVFASGPHTDTKFRVKVAEWDEWRQELFVAGHSGHRCDILIYNAGNMVEIGQAYCPDKRWSVTIEDLEQVPCRIYAEQLASDTCDYQDDYMDVQYAPDDCGP
jgi:hypothetical protein